MIYDATVRRPEPLTAEQLAAIARAIGTDLLRPYVPPARPFTLGDASSFGIRRDYHPRRLAGGEQGQAVAHHPVVTELARRLSAALGKTGVVRLSGGLLPPSRREESITRDQVIVCDDVLSRVDDPAPLLRRLHAQLQIAAVAVVSTPLRALTMRTDDLGPPAEELLARTWTFPELQAGLDAFGIEPLFGGILDGPPGTTGAPTIGVIIAAVRTTTAGHWRTG